MNMPIPNLEKPAKIIGFVVFVLFIVLVVKACEQTEPTHKETYGLPYYKGIYVMSIDVNGSKYVIARTPEGSIAICPASK